MTIKEIFEKTKSANKPVTQLLSKGSNSKLIGIGLRKDVVLKEHKAPGPTTMVILKGQLEYTTKESVKNFYELNEYQIPLEEIHSVKGVEDCVFLLFIQDQK